MHSLKSRRRKEGPCQAPVPPSRIFQAPAPLSSSSQRSQLYDHPRLRNNPNQRLRHLLLGRWGHDVHLSREVGHPHARRKSQCEISSLSASCNLIGLDVRWALQTTLFITLVNSRALGTTSENDTHLPTRRWRLLTETVEDAWVCWIKSRNFSFFSGIRWNTSREESHSRKYVYVSRLPGAKLGDEFSLGYSPWIWWERPWTSLIPHTWAATPEESKPRQNLYRIH